MSHAKTPGILKTDPILGLKVRMIFFPSLDIIIIIITQLTGSDRFKTRHYVILHVFLRHTFLLPVEIGYTCLTLCEH